MELLSFAVIGLMAGAAALWRIPAARCEHCPHCLAERREEEARRDEALHRQTHAAAGPDCPICQRDRGG